MSEAGGIAEIDDRLELAKRRKGFALEDRSPWFILAFAGACVLGSAYGFLQGAWPFGLVEGFGPL
jgi:hypothetical protein